MAERYDKEFIERVGIYYEMYEKTASEIASHFDLKVKTVESWIKRNEWVKGRLKGKADELKKQMDKDKYAAMVGIMAEEGVTDGAIEAMGGDMKRADMMIQNLTLDQISSSVLDNQMRYAVQKAHAFAATAKNINTIKTYAEIVKMAKETIHGKSPDTVINFQLGDITPQEIASMSDVEIRRLLEQAKNEAIEAQVTEVKHGD